MTPAEGAYRGHRAGGFTLLELLIAITILSIITTIVYATFVSVTDTMDAAREDAERLHLRLVLHDYLSTVLAGLSADSACLDEARALEGKSENGPTGPGNSLAFTSATPDTGPGALPGMIKLVTLEVVSDQDVPQDAVVYALDTDQPHGNLLISEQSLQASSGLEGAVSGTDKLPVISRAIPIVFFDALYYDGLSDEWKEEWNSLDEGRLPWAIWIRIKLPDPTNATYPSNPDAADVDVIVPVAQGVGTEVGFLDFNHMILTSTSGLDSRDRNRNQQK
ncbi:MAG TPA: prepilin-type N-terminal cleavage/methylation domain-containing protein [Candidatus Hydrogenedentes bacterium]|nr:prepilin-type N-terminal cleavage/methylation domain-containing protein [Candidatus Hydrogenedentota bacterium]